MSHGTPNIESITRIAPASRCVWLRGVPGRVGYPVIADECARYASVDKVLPGLHGDDVVVVFSTVRCVCVCNGV